MKWFQGTADAVRQFTWLFEDARLPGVRLDIENILYTYSLEIRPIGWITWSWCRYLNHRVVSRIRLKEPIHCVNESLSVYALKIEVKLLTSKYPTSNAFGLEVIHSA